MDLESRVLRSKSECFRVGEGCEEDGGGGIEKAKEVCEVEGEILWERGVEKTM